MQQEHCEHLEVWSCLAVQRQAQARDKFLQTSPSPVETSAQARRPQPLRPLLTTVGSGFPVLRVWLRLMLLHWALVAGLAKHPPDAALAWMEGTPPQALCRKAIALSYAVAVRALHRLFQRRSHWALASCGEAWRGKARKIASSLRPLRKHLLSKADVSDQHACKRKDAKHDSAHRRTSLHGIAGLAGADCAVCSDSCSSSPTSMKVLRTRSGSGNDSCGWRVLESREVKPELPASSSDGIEISKSLPFLSRPHGPRAWGAREVRRVGRLGTSEYLGFGSFWLSQAAVLTTRLCLQASVICARDTSCSSKDCTQLLFYWL